MTAGTASSGAVEDRPSGWKQYLSVDADLSITVDTAAGDRATGRLTGNGHRLRLEFDRPEVLRGAADRATVTAVAAELARAQLHAELHGPRGRLAAVVPGRTSRIAAVLTGSPHVVLDRAAWALVARTAAPVVAVVAGGVALGVVAALVRRSAGSSR